MIDKDTKKIMKEALKGASFNFRDPSFRGIFAIQEETAGYLNQFNNERNPIIRQKLLEKITGKEVPKDVIVFQPLRTDFGRHIFLKSGDLINTECLLNDAGGIYLDENVLLGPRVSLITVNHDRNNRNIMITKPIHIHKNAWIGTGAIVLPGVTIGENSIVGAGAIVTKDVPANTTVVGNPARAIKKG